MSWAEVKKINSDIGTPLNELILGDRQIRYYFYENTSFVVPYDTKLTIRCNGAGGNGYFANGAGGGGGGYCKDLREYKKGDIINITVSESSYAQAVCADRELSMIAYAGSTGTSSTGGSGGTATGGNLRNATGGAGGVGANGASSTYGCGGGGSASSDSSAYGKDGGSGGFSGGNGSGSYYRSGGNGGSGGFSGGNGGYGAGAGASSSSSGGAGGDSAYGIGGNGGCTIASGTGHTTTGGKGGNGKIFGGNGGYTNDAKGAPGMGGDGIIPGNGGINESNGGSVSSGSTLYYAESYYNKLPKRVNHGGGGAARGYTNGSYAINLNDEKRGIGVAYGGVACCMITLGEDKENF